MKKYQAIIAFEMDEEFMSFVPPHRTYINYLLNKGIIDSYAVSMETQNSWITINANNKKEVKEYLDKSPFFWGFPICPLFLQSSKGGIAQLV